MTVQVSASAVVILVIAGAVGMLVYSWSQRRNEAGVPQERGDLGQAIAAAAAVGALLAAVLALPGAPAAADPSAPDPTTPKSTATSPGP